MTPEAVEIIVTDMEATAANEATIPAGTTVTIDQPMHGMTWAVATGATKTIQSPTGHDGQRVTFRPETVFEVEWHTPTWDDETGEGETTRMEWVEAQFFTAGPCKKVEGPR